MITLSFDLVDPNSNISANEIIEESGMNRKDLHGVNVIVHHNHPYDEIQIQVGNYESAIKLVALYNGIKLTHVTPEDIEAHQLV